MPRVTADRNVADRVAGLLGPDRLGAPGAFAPDGEPAEVVVEPRSEDELARVLALACEEGWSVVPAGTGGWLAAGNRLRGADLVLSTRRLDAIVDVEPADLVATVQAGVTLSMLDARLRESGVWWPVQPPGEGTVGATIATGVAGPLQTGFGLPRDLVLGLTVVRADGVRVQAGGRVVKNVAGYNMVRLFTGSWGTLGVITAAHLRLYPLPAADRTRVYVADGPAPLMELIGALGSGAALPPAALELLSPSAAGALGLASNEWGAAVRWLGHEAAVAAAVEAAEDAAFNQGLRVETPSALWDRIAGIEDRIRPVLVVRVSVPIQATQAIIGLCRSFAGGQTPALIAAPLTGRIWVFISRALYESVHGDRIWTLRLDDLRRTAAEWGGSARIERAPPEIRESTDAWGDPAAARLHESLKREFDPKRILNPGRFIAGT